MYMNNAYLQWNQNEPNETCMNNINKRIFTSKKQEKNKLVFNVHVKN